jgi:ribosomal protein S21
MADPRETKEKKFTPVVLPENVPVDYNFERMLKSFIKQVDKTGILKEVKARRYYIKPSERKREEAKKRRKI